MPLPLTVEKIEDAPESARGAYIEKDGKFHLDAEIEDVSGLKESHRRALDEKKKLDATLKGILGNRKPEDIAAILSAHESAEEKRMRDAGESEKVVAKRLAERDAEWQQKYDAVAPYKSKYEDKELDVAIRDAAARAGVIPEDMKLVIPIVKGSRVKLDDTGKVAVFDADGDPTGLTVDKFFAETFRKEAPKFYVAGGGSGGGSTGGSGNRSVTTGAQASDLNDFVSRITSDKNALAEGKAGKLTVRG